MAKRSSKSVLTVPKFIRDLTTNVYVLYLVAFFALVNVLGYMAMGKNICVLLFILIAVVTSYFSKNMVFVLAVPTFLVGFFAICDKARGGLEGLEGMEEIVEGSKVVHSDDDTKKGMVVTKTADEMVIDMSDGSKKTVTKDEMANWILDNTDDNTDDNTEDNTDDTDDEPEASESVVEGIGKKTNLRNGFRSAGSKGDRIDYASTLEDAYSNLNNILGKDGIKNLTNDTQALMKQQLQLASAMKGMQPLIGQAKDMMSSLGDFGDLSKLTEGLKGVAK